MNRIIVATENGDARKAIAEAMEPEYKLEVATKREVCLRKIREIRYDYVFIDTSILSPQTGAKNFENYLREFRHSFPTLEIIVMAPQEKTREAVNAVQSGANSYLTYPFPLDEVKLVIQSLQESLLLQGELNYFRDEFWKKESLGLIRTKNILMKKSPCP